MTGLSIELKTMTLTKCFCLQAFSGSGFRLDGKKKKNNASSAPVPLGPVDKKRFVKLINQPRQATLFPSYFLYPIGVQHIIFT